jgi:hypothetical protein
VERLRQEAENHVTVAIVTILAPLVSLLAAWLARRWKKADDPLQQTLDAREAADRAVFTGDADRVNVLLNDGLQNARRRAGSGRKS